jgi:septum formation protein
VDETPYPGESPGDHVARLAAAKAAAVCERFPGRVVLAADTSVVLEERIFGKPADREDARRMLALLQGRIHEVLTGYVVADGRGALRRGVARSLVTMRPLSGPEIEAYLEVGEYGDKAGAYAAQGKGSGLVERIEGSYTNVVGLPLEPVRAILLEFGYTPVEPGLDGEPGDGRPGPVLY